MRKLNVQLVNVVVLSKSSFGTAVPYSTSVLQGQLVR